MTEPASPEGRPGAERFFAPAKEGLGGRVRVPGDKSISHRAVLLGAVSRIPVRVRGFLPSADTLATVAAVRALGVAVEPLTDEETRAPVSGSAPPARLDLLVRGAGWEGLREPADVIDVGNAGTLIRLLPGLVASLPFLCVFTGDESIRGRPMARVVKPLQGMGAQVLARGQGGLAPLAIVGGRLRGGVHELAVASAQVKSCLLLAGLRAEAETAVVEPGPSRDHTERMLRHAGVEVQRDAPATAAGTVRLSPVASLALPDVTVPGDFSSAAFLLVAALLIPGSDITVTGVGLNPTRTGLLDVLQDMDARLEVRPESDGQDPEPVGEIRARSSTLRAVDVGADRVPLLIDELPIWALAAARAHGVSRLRGAAELRVKESDRLAAVAELLRALGVPVVEHPDGLDIEGRPGGRPGGVLVRSRGDHRLAMTGAVAGLAADEGVTLDDYSCVDVSFPGFAATIDSLRL
jgi:3-phosphoshikimate 1-carboxyvinyltransferase